MFEDQNDSCERVCHENLNFMDNFQNNSGSNLTDFCNCIVEEMHKVNWDFQRLGNYSLDIFDNLCPEKKILLEIFDFHHNLVPNFEGRIWIEWIWGLVWLLLIEVIGNGCLFTTIVYER